MPQITIPPIPAGELFGLLLHIPLFSLVVAAVIAAAVLVIRRSRASGVDRRRERSADPATALRYRPEHLALAVGAILVIAAFATENIVRGYLLRLANVVEWWQYATPVFAALVVVAAAFVLIVARKRTPEQPAPSNVRRTWATFGPRAGIAGALLALLALVTTTIAAGLASSPDADGRWILLVLTAPNATIDDVRPWFYGWAFGVPVLVCTAALVLATWLTLRSNAARPFLRPDTIAAETIARAEVANGTVSVAAAGMLLALGGAWRFIARSGSIGSLEIEGVSGSFDITWRYAEFAVVGGWLAPAVEVVAFVLLLLVASRLRRRPAGPAAISRPSSPTHETASAR
ncbi:hypothetical protein ASD23_02775 [Agromyces sp. Root1464]|uniref:hypothetical protein n=1 Tax=Agromyces sp. Root1464 TaxID=1736467 RepID=UPI0006FC439A|nr:hypothetical protein [Agromyces sp. Root1464]KQZ11056.1 hypothetical protein ASD23_02775 [Agromyces sp. Root1464]